MKKMIRIASRESQLAMWQANYIADRIREKYSDTEVSVLSFKTQGDIILDQPLAEIGGKGLFIKELEHALLNDDADLAVHSMKDVPMDLPEPFEICAISERENPSDAFVSNKYASLDELPQNAVVGTSSLRRQSLIKYKRPDLIIESLRGNLQTRLNKLDSGIYDAIILASAGLIRLNLENRIKSSLDVNQYTPSVGQGALGIEILKNKSELKEFLDFLNDEQTQIQVEAERKISKTLAGSCTVPMGAHASIKDNLLTIQAFVSSPDGIKMICATDSGPCSEHLSLANNVARSLIDQGAKNILGIGHG
jgi:hydroxymethylbilane synthase